MYVGGQDLHVRTYVDIEIVHSKFQMAQHKCSVVHVHVYNNCISCTGRLVF